MHSLKDLVAELEGTAQLHGEIAKLYLSSISWYNKLGRESQQRLADSSRRLLNLITRYITEPAKREETIQLARNVGHEFGETLAKIGLPLTDSVEAFILHRDPLMRAATHLVSKKEVPNGRVVAAIPQVAYIMDEALLSLVAAHQNYWGNSQKGPQGDATE